MNKKKTKTKQKKMCKENENGHIVIQIHTLRGKTVPRPLGHAAAE